MYAGLLQSSVRLNPIPFLQLTSSSRSADLPLSNQKPMDRNKSKTCIYFYGTGIDEFLILIPNLKTQFL